MLKPTEWRIEDIKGNTHIIPLDDESIRQYLKTEATGQELLELYINNKDEIDKYIIDKAMLEYEDDLRAFLQNKEIEEELKSIDIKLNKNI